MKKNRIKDFNKKIKENIEEIHYNMSSAAPWFKHYDYMPKTLSYPAYTLFEYVEHTASIYPENYAYEYYGKLCTYNEFINKITRCAKAMQAIGIKENDFVTICMPNVPEAIIAFYAINLLGAIANMVHPLSSENELIFYIKKSNSKYVFTMDLLYDKLAKIMDQIDVNKIILCKANNDMKALTSFVYWIASGRKIKVENKPENVIFWKDFIYLSREVKEVNRTKKSNKELAVILYSGGTTGDPKGIMLSSHNFNAIALQNSALCTNVKPGASLLAIMPIFHGFGLGICFHTVLVAGMKSIIIPKFKLEDFAKLIKTYKPNFIAGVPTLYEGLLSSNIKKDELSCVTTAVCGGDMLSPLLKKQVNEFLKAHGSTAEILIGYGMTECVASVVGTPMGAVIDNSIGMPMPDSYVKIVKAGTTENVYYDDDGEICISGPSVMMGYLNNEEETKNTLKVHEDGRTWLHSGDIGSMDKTGTIFFKTRLKRIIISSGYNIYPSYVEGIINSHPKVLTSIVVGMPDQYRGEIAKAFIVLKPEFSATEELQKEIKQFCKANIAKYSLPTSFEYRGALPKTLINKIDYRKLQNEKK